MNRCKAGLAATVRFLRLDRLMKSGQDLRRGDKRNVSSEKKQRLCRGGAQVAGEASPFLVQLKNPELQSQKGTSCERTTNEGIGRGKSLVESNKTVMRTERTSSYHSSLRRQFDILQGYLWQAQDELEYRHELLDEDRRQYYKDRAAGKNVPDQLAFDLEQFQETQRLTRAVVEAERNLAEAKAEALAAGADINSDIESDFVFDPDDGDRISEADDDAALADPSVIPAWLEKLPDGEPVSPDELVEDATVDHWDAQSVEIYDSWSMRAEGVEKRRIKRWRDLLSKSLQHVAS